MSQRGQKQFMVFLEKGTQTAQSLVVVIPEIVHFSQPLT